MESMMWKLNTGDTVLSEWSGALPRFMSKDADLAVDFLIMNPNSKLGASELSILVLVWQG